MDLELFFPAICGILGVAVVVGVFVHLERTKSTRYCTINIPDGWVKKWEPEFLITAYEPVNPDKEFPTCLNITMTKPFNKGDLDHNMQSLKGALMSEAPGKMEILEEGDTQLDGIKARWIKYFCVVEENELINLTYMVIKGRRAFVLTFASASTDFDRNKPKFDNAIQSFRIK